MSDDSGSDNEFLAEIRAGFLQEASDAISAVEGSFLALEKDPGNVKEFQQILRLFHNLKGSAAAVGFNHLSELCHKVENLLVKVKEKKLELTEKIIELLLLCTDHANQATATLTKNHSAALDFRTPLHEIEIILGADPGAHVSSSPTLQTAPATKTNTKLFFDTLENISALLVLSDENNLEAVLSLSKQIKILLENLPEESAKKGETLKQVDDHLAKVLDKNNGAEEFEAARVKLTELLELIQKENFNITTGQNSLDAELELDPILLQDFFADACEYLESADTNLMILEKDSSNTESIDAVFRGFHTIKSAAAIVNIRSIESLAHALESTFEAVRDKKTSASPKILSMCLQGTTLIKKLVDTYAQGKPGNIKAAMVEQADFIKRLTSNGDEKAPESQAQGQTQAQSQSQGATTSAVREPIKVDADRLDRLIDNIGELVIAETMVSQSKDIKTIDKSSVLFRHLDHLNKITRGLQEIGLALRMVSIRQTFKKMVRIVRDVSKKMDKDIDFQMFGEDTELDRTVAEKIGDPLVHMVRNAIDHGIEKTREERIKAGKSPTGHVKLSALHKGGSIWIEIQDDGRGLDKDALTKKAIEKGLITAGTVLSEQEAYHLIFAPGFSTAEKVTDVSGRGVGMDVVRKNIEELRGQIDIETVKGKGTLFRIRIPNTLAIIEGMVVQVADERYVIPTQSIQMAIQIEQKHLVTSSGTKQEMLDIHGEFLPLARLSQLYNIKKGQADALQGIVLIVEDNQNRIGLLVDRILNQQQFVIKNLGDMMKGVPGVSGGTIMPDGQVGLILDVGLLIQGLLIKKQVGKLDKIEKLAEI